MKTVNEILAEAPEISETDRRIMNESFTPYMFYSESKDFQVQHCICSSCREHFDISHLQRTQTPEDRLFLAAGHNQSVVCPKCGRTMQKKHIGISKKCRCLYEYGRFVLLLPTSRDVVFMIYVYATKNYCKPKKGNPAFVLEYDTMPDFEVNAIYRLTPNEQQMITYSPWSKEWEMSEKIKEPFTKTWYYNFGAQRGYGIIGLERLGETFLRYFNFHGFQTIWNSYAHDTFFGWSREFPACKALAQFARYKSFEFLEKQGYGALIYSMLDRERPAESLYDWQATTPYKFFKQLSKPEIKALKNADLCTRNDLFLYVRLRRNKKFNVDTFISLKSCFSFELQRYAQTAARLKLDHGEVINYIVKKKFERAEQMTARLWLDYLECAEICGYDMSVHNVIFPRALKTAHDNAVANKNRLIVEREKEKLRETLENEKARLENGKDAYAKRYARLKEAYEYSDSTYQIQIPTGAAEIIIEGKSLQHCVGGYAARHIKGNTTILFMRSRKNSQESLITIEIDDKSLNIRQVHGLNNRAPNKQEDAFIKKWISEVVQRKSKKTKAA